MNQGVVLFIIGNEILAGRRQDVHFANTLAACQARGIRIQGVHYLPDEAQTLLDAFTQIANQPATVLSFGGIGATPDDKTRATVAKALNLPLEFHPQGLQILQEKFNDELNEQRKQLVLFPQGAALIPNPINHIPGFSIANIHCVPGFPQMAQPMIEWVLDHHCQGLRQALVYQFVTAYLAESQAIPLLEALEQQFPDVSVSCLPKLHHELELGFEGNAAHCQAALNTTKAWLEQYGFNYH